MGKDRPALDIVNQLRLTRTDGGAHGIVFWNASSLRKDLGGVASGLAREVFAQPALVPATPWAISHLPLSVGRPVLGARL